MEKIGSYHCNHFNHSTKRTITNTGETWYYMTFDVIQYEI